MNHRMLTFLVALTLGSSVPASASDVPPIEASDPETERVLELHRAGDAYFDANDCAKAREMYAAAYALKQNYQIAGSLGDCELQLGQYRNAAEHIDRFIREYPPDKPRERLEQAQTLLAQAKAHVGTLRLDVGIVGADIFVDGQAIGKAPIARDIYVEPGSHRIEAKTGVDVVRQTVDVPAGEERTVALKLQPQPLAKPVEKPPTTQGGGSRLGWVGLTSGVAVVGIGTGIALGLVAYSKDRARDEILTDLSKESGKSKDRVCGFGTDYEAQCGQVRGHRDQKHVFQNVAIGAFAVGAAGLATAFVLGLTSNQSTTQRRVGASVIVTPTRGGFAVTGRF